MTQNKSVEEVVGVAIANLIFSGLSIAQMQKIPKWLLENIEKNKSDFKEKLRQTSQEREREIVEAMINNIISVSIDYNMETVVLTRDIVAISNKYLKAYYPTNPNKD